MSHAPSATSATAPSRGGTTARWEPYALPALLLVGWLLRLWRLASEPLWLDEAYTWLAVEVFHSGGLTGLAAFDHIGPGYYLVASALDAVGLHGAWGLRLGAAAAGVAAIDATFRLVRAITGHRLVALGAAAFVTVSPMAVWYSQEARGYSLMLALTTYYLLLVWHELRTTRPWRLVAIAVLVAVLLWVHQYSMFVFAAMVVLVVWRTRHDVRRMAGLAAAHLVGLAALVPWVVLSWHRLTEQTATGPQTILPRIPYNLLTMLVGQTYGPSNIQIRDEGIRPAVLGNLPTLGLFGVALALALWGLWRARGRFTRLQLEWLACMLVVPNLALVAATVATHSLYHVRYLITLLPLVGWLFGVLVAHARRDRVALAAVVLSSLVMAWSLIGHYTNPAYGKEDYRQAPRVIVNEYGPGDALLLGNRLAIPSLLPYGFDCPPNHGNVLGPDALASLRQLPVDRTPGHDTFTLETRQWETVPAWQLDPVLDELLGKPVRTWTWNGVVLTQRPGAFQFRELPMLDMHCDRR